MEPGAGRMGACRITTLNACEKTTYRRGKRYGDDMAKTEDYLIETADRVKRLVKLGNEVASDLEVISNELMNKAVELETERQKNDKRAGGKR
jgi:hypothetical protein